MFVNILHSFLSLFSHHNLINYNIAYTELRFQPKVKLMNLNKLLEKKCITLHEQIINDSILAVKETSDYRWFEHGGQDIQSIMSLKKPEQVLTPVSQSLLMFLLWNTRPLKVLNLGLGGGTFERALALMPNVSLTSVELFQQVIDVAKKHFNLAENANVVCDSADNFIKSTNIKFDVILCDLFIDEKNPDFLFSNTFYEQLQKIMLKQSVVMLNVQADSNEQLLLVLCAIRNVFPYVALIEFSDYKNIVVMCSTDEIPEKSMLIEKLTNFNKIDLSGLKNIIPKIRHIPHQ